MKKVYLLFASALVAFSSSAQVVANAGMETWRTNTSGTGPVVTIQAPTQWFGFDSTIVAYGELFGAIAGFGSDWHQQVFQEGTFVHAGVGAAKVMTVKQDELGFIAGTLSTAKIDVDLAALSGGGDPMSAILYDGGTPVSQRITTVSAWTAYFAGKDSVTGIMGGPDAGLLTVQAIAVVGGSDSIIGTGFVPIMPSSAYTQVTANLTYTTHLYDVSLVRIIFTSSGGLGASLDSSTLYVDDVTMTGEPQGVGAVTATDVVSVFPNPATGTLYLNAPVGNTYGFVLASVSGQVVTTQALTGTGKVDVSKLPTGIYLYSITDATGNTVQRGKVNVNN